MHYIFSKFLKGLLPLATLLAPENMVAQEIVYQDFYQQLQQLEDAGNFHGALELLLERRSTFPEKYFALLKEEIYIQEKLERHEENLDLFRQGHQRGYFFFMHPALSAFKPYRDFVEFDSLSHEDLKLREEALEGSETIYKVVFPDNFSVKNVHPVCLIFHGGGSSLNRVMDHWRSPTLNADFIRVYIQSYLHYDSQTFGWRSGDERAFRDVREIFQHVLSKHPVDSSEVFVAGMSAGATFAIDLALRQIIPVKGILAFCPGIPKIVSDQKLKEAPSAKGFILGGEDDYYLPRQKEMIQYFKKIRFTHRHEVVAGMAHHYPVNESEWIELALKYLKE